MAKHCRNYCGLACIDGSCPNAQYEAADERYGYGIAEDMGLEKVKCKDCYKYKGSFDEFPENHDLGDVILVNGKTYAWIGDRWDCLEAVDNTQEPEVDTSKDFQPILCKQCGAPLDPRKDRCDFCHTWYHNSRLHQKYNW